MGVQGMAAGAVAAAVVGAIGVIVAALITVWGSDGNGGGGGPGSVVQTNRNGDNVACVGEHLVCAPGATARVSGPDLPTPHGSSGG
ncbi:hypothetical protein [Streptomyces sp. G45]|uniref:hypothetical protein n=1 Tax=Streptomyces sp. G45 TaxID=3406627 RepID=UPI003C1E188E